ncbi:glutathione S-transferase [Fimicolochytrium jonesii]|uniref:glutathione S-transferase n=1 Tax=Fimicolochytrium jonesii TaxID=1396493 RepID=UPI0022FEDE94|nr:glutathione S-transferase [Fimicolochytrium jonesii]KAI8822458.1 glutathione S-transferase [Fimicolochytrium jonesii]
MSLEFYHAPYSTADITKAVLTALQTPHKLHTLSFATKDTRKPEFLALNPNGQVPVIVHDNVPIFESAAITLYLGETFGVEKGLYPPPGPQRGEAMKWVIWSNVNFSRPLYVLMSAKGGGAFSKEEIDAANETLNNLLGTLTKGLEGKGFLLGSWSVVDIHVGSMMGYGTLVGMDTTEFPAVQAYVKRCEKKMEEAEKAAAAAK